MLVTKRFRKNSCDSLARLRAPMSAMSGRALRLDVKAINVPEKYVGNELVISTDRLEHRLGKGLDDEALRWLRDYLESAVAAV